MYISLFKRLKNYTSNPIDEYHKLSSFLKDAVADRFNGLYLYRLLSDAFLYCKELRRYFASLDDCIDSNCSNLEKYQLPAEPYYTSLEESEKDVLIDEFLTFCQVILTCLFYLDKNINQILTNHFSNEIDNKIVNQFTELVASSLNSFNYKCILPKDSLNVEIVMDNPVAEVIASESSEDIYVAIMGYLGNRDTKTKEKYLHEFVDLLEPTIKKYSEQPLIRKIREYIQLLRHPETKKENKEYKWYFSNKRKYIDKLFELCLLIQQYDLSKKIVDEFENNKSN